MKVFTRGTLHAELVPQRNGLEVSATEQPKIWCTRWKIRSYGRCKVGAPILHTSFGSIARRTRPHRIDLRDCPTPVDLLQGSSGESLFHHVFVAPKAAAPTFRMSRPPHNLRTWRPSELTNIAILSILFLFIPVLATPVHAAQPPEDDNFISPLTWENAATPQLEDQALDSRILEGRVIPNLVQIEGLAVRFSAQGFEMTRERYEGPVTMNVSGTLKHPFDTPVRDIRIRLIFLPHGALERAWRRMMASPLLLTDKELAEALPRPWMSWARRAFEKNTVAPGEIIDLSRTTDYEELALNPMDLPGYLALLDGYELEEPTAQDLIKIVQNGGVMDLAAVARWAESSELDHTRFEPNAQKRLISTIIARLDKMRAPMGHGGLIRLHTLLSLTRILASPNDLERLLELERSMQILLTSAGLTYYDAVEDENHIELPIHSVRELPSLVEYMESYKLALQNIRRMSFPRLLELAFDPLDFRNASKESGLRVSKVQAQAKGLLEPLAPVNVNEILNAASEDVDMQRDILNFYIRAQHAPAVVPMMRWLQDHPYELEGVGLNAARQIGQPVVPTLLRYYLEPIDAQQRQIARAMILELPPEAAQDVLNAIRGSGILINRDAKLESALDAFEERERMVYARQADELEAEALGPDAQNTSLSRRLRAIEQLARIAPDRLQTRSKEVIELLAHAAERLHQSSPTESARAMEMMENLPLGQASLDALDKLAMVRARNALQDENAKIARKILIEHDPDLRVRQIRQLYGDITYDSARQSIYFDQFQTARSLITDGEKKLPEDPRFRLLRDDLFLAEYWPALVMGGLFSLSAALTSSFLAARGLTTFVRKLAQRRLHRSADRDHQKHGRAVLLRDSEGELDDLEHELAHRYAEADSIAQWDNTQSAPSDSQPAPKSEVPRPALQVDSAFVDGATLYAVQPVEAPEATENQIDSDDSSAVESPNDATPVEADVSSTDSQTDSPSPTPEPSDPVHDRESSFADNDLSLEQDSTAEQTTSEAAADATPEAQLDAEIDDELEAMFGNSLEGLQESEGGEPSLSSDESSSNRPETDANAELADPETGANIPDTLPPHLSIPALSVENPAPSPKPNPSTEQDLDLDSDQDLDADTDGALDLDADQPLEANSDLDSEQDLDQELDQWFDELQDGAEVLNSDIQASDLAPDESNTENIQSDLEPLPFDDESDANPTADEFAASADEEKSPLPLDDLDLATEDDEPANSRPDDGQEAA